MRWIRPVALMAASLALPAAACASMLFVNFDNFNYTGMVTRFASLADAQAGQNPLSSSTISTATNGPRSTLPNARDASLFLDAGAPDTYLPGDYAFFATAWYFTTTPVNGNGWGNPNNTCDGFTQYLDDATGGLQGAVTGGWAPSLSRFTLGLHGGSGDSAGAARAWAGGAGCGDGGLFRSFDLSLEANFAGTATLNGGTGLYEMDANPTLVTGGLTAIFQNDSSSVPANNGFYLVQLQFQNGSWANDSGAVWVDSAQQFSPESFFAGEVVPEPLGSTLVAIGLVGMGLISRRRVPVAARIGDR